MTNFMRLEFPSIGENVAFARTTMAMFASQLDFTLDELDEIKVATSEAVSNCVIHAYHDETGLINIYGQIFPDRLEITVSDTGRGIPSIEEAMEPSFTTVPDERMGLGLVFIKEYMDELEIKS
ncbi:MAG: anti-sigma F factor, partial [Limnochordia bacterium]